MQRVSACPAYCVRLVLRRTAWARGGVRHVAVSCAAGVLRASMGARTYCVPRWAFGVLRVPVGPA
ncbi:hypothetical protein [Kribbella pratensis]|uniref:hypothetical protein n=1 Tax=Kribbella pratensis TaxID=2512112 RepID=UPI00106612EA|nr:hypothetical protein [Kribbella pratensis]